MASSWFFILQFLHNNIKKEVKKKIIYCQEFSGISDVRNDYKSQLSLDFKIVCNWSED